MKYDIARKLGYLLGVTVQVCLIAILIALTVKFLLWLF